MKKCVSVIPLVTLVTVITTVVVTTHGVQLFAVVGLTSSDPGIAEQKDQRRPGGFGGGVDDRKAPIAIVGDNIYISWWTNRTGNDEVQLRASTDGGATFADKINLSNSTNTESQDVEIAAEGDNVIVTWWERNAISEEPVARISSDNGATFGPLLKLATNGTNGEAAETG